MSGTRFIAEVSSNHSQDLKRCLQFVDVAASIGCSDIKFQLFRVDELFAKEILAKSRTHLKRKKWELPLEFIPTIAAQCQKKNIGFGCTPFYLEAVPELEQYVDFFKISSYELLWLDLLQKCAGTGKPLIVSTGMANKLEIERAIKTIKNAGCIDFSVLHCVSGYPAPVSECNLAAIDTLRQLFSVSCGWSDHSRDAGVILRAVNRWQAEIIEFHLDLDGKGEEYSNGHCWLPQQICEVIVQCKSGLLADGDARISISASENADRSWRADPIDGLRPLQSIRGKF